MYVYYVEIDGISTVLLHVNIIFMTVKVVQSDCWLLCCCSVYRIVVLGSDVVVTGFGVQIVHIEVNIDGIEIVSVDFRAVKFVV